jgi:hypothetical protein
MALRTLRVFIGLFVLMIPAAVAHRMLVGRGAYKDSTTYGTRGTREISDPYPELFSKGWHIKVMDAEIRAHEKQAGELEAKLALLSSQLVTGQAPPP